MSRHSFSGKYIKPLLRFFYYKNERRKFFREINVKSAQKKLLHTKYDRNTENLIIFLVPGADWFTGKDAISGGVLSIASLYSETEKLEDVHGCKLMMCTFPSHHLLLRHTNFSNDIDVFSFDQVTNYFVNLKKLIIHVPEFLVPHFRPSISDKQFQYLKAIPILQINILNQNIRMMPGRDAIQELGSFTNNLTVTTAHQKYCTRSYREKYGIPLHFFSTFASPENYKFTPYTEKENLLVFSPDDDQKNTEITDLLAKNFPALQTKIIRGLKYDQYKELVGKAKWSITFGEGLDFYFIEPVFSGGMGFALYNEDFFTPDFKEINTIYPSFEALKERIVADIRAMDNESEYAIFQKKQFDLCAKYYSKEQYRKNIAAFYRHEYSFP